MKNIHDVLTQKIADLKRVQEEVRALYSALPLLAEASDAQEIQKLLDLNSQKGN